MSAENVYHLVQSVLEQGLSPQDEAVQTALGLNEGQGQVFWVVLNALEQSGEIADLSKTLKAAGYSAPHINGMRAKKLIARKGKTSPWTLTKRATKKLRGLVAETAPSRSASTIEAAADSQDQATATTPKQSRAFQEALTLTLPEVAEVFKRRLAVLDAEIEGKRGEITAMEEERVAMVAEIKKLAGGIG